MVNDDVNKMYGKIVEYLTSKATYFEDPSSIPDEFNDVNGEFNLTSFVNAIQMQIDSRPTLGEAATTKAYRDIRATQAEYDIRLMKRTDYLTDSATEERDNIAKWGFNQKVIIAQMDGKDTGL